MNASKQSVHSLKTGMILLSEVVVFHNVFVLSDILPSTTYIFLIWPDGE